MPPRNITAVVRELCLSFPEAEEVAAHGMSNFRVRGKIFAVYALNHHGDGRIALWLNAPAGAQSAHLRGAPRHFFVPPYVGPRGWLGVVLDRGLAWQRIAELVREAYEKVAPARLSVQIGKLRRIRPPSVPLRPETIDPFASKRGLAVLKAMRGICLTLPETSEARQFGHPVWRVGKKVFARAISRERGIGIAFWVGRAQQGLFTADPLFSVPPYIGHNGWIELDVAKSADWKVVRSLIVQSYRHYASKRMLRLMDLPLL
ncbi:MAG: MmcQ/YjbR family DNA-binding protein [Steroidobacteraceae bacterium]